MSWVKTRARVNLHLLDAGVATVKSDWMSNVFLVQLGGSAVSIMVLVLLSAWARISRPTPALDGATVRPLIRDEFPDAEPDSIWFSMDGASAVAKAGEEALIIFRLGDGFVTRTTPWAQLAQARRTGDQVAIRLSDPAAPCIRLRVDADAAWPPVLNPMDAR